MAHKRADTIRERRTGSISLRGRAARDGRAAEAEGLNALAGGYGGDRGLIRHVAGISPPQEANSRAAGRPYPRPAVSQIDSILACGHSWAGTVVLDLQGKQSRFRRWVGRSRPNLNGPRYPQSHPADRGAADRRACHSIPENGTEYISEPIICH